MQRMTRRLSVAAAILVAAGGLTVTFVSGGGRETASAQTSLALYVPIEGVKAGVAGPRPGRRASTGVFTVDCGTNGNRKFSPDNPVAQPGVKNGAEHLHDFVGNKAINADSKDAELAKAGTTCRSGDRSSYFWPVVRIDRAVRGGPSAGDTVPKVSCPSVRGRMPAVPRAAKAETSRLLAELDTLQAAADRWIAAGRGPIDAKFNESVIGPVRARRSAIIRQLIDVLDRSGPRPDELVSMVDCEVSYDGMHQHGTKAATPAPSGPVAPSGPDLELPGNTGGIVRPAQVLIQYRGNATGGVRPMPRFLRALTGDAKPTSRGPANARASWSCGGFADRLSTKYTICPQGSRVLRVHDFPGCWDGKNVDSDNHRAHVAFADPATGACPANFVAIPQLRVTIAYNIPRDVQQRGQYALDSFPEENHNPFSDHDDFVNVNSARQMALIAACLNAGRRCR